MKHPWQDFLELVWPSRYDPIASRERRIALLQTAIAIAIPLAAGPEIFLAMEMTALLEVLGAILFLAAFAAGAKLLASIPGPDIPGRASGEGNVADPEKARPCC